QILVRAVGVLEVQVDLVRHAGVETEHRDLHQGLADPAPALERGERVAGADRLRGASRLRTDAPGDRLQDPEARAVPLEEADDGGGPRGPRTCHSVAPIGGDLERRRATAGDEHGKEGGDQPRDRDHAGAEPALPRGVKRFSVGTWVARSPDGRNVRSQRCQGKTRVIRSDAELLGARRCPLNGGMTASVLYRRRGESVTLFLPRTGSPVSEETERLALGDGGCTVGSM